MWRIVVIIMYATNCVDAYGYDSGTDGACGRPRTGRARTPPCDLGRQGWCTTAGTAYPWHAVRRFVRENQGLMRRMYGDERHLAVLKAELQTNDIEQVNVRYANPDSELGNYYKSRYGKESDNFAYENELFQHNSPTTFKEESTGRLLHRDGDDILRTKFVYSDDVVETRRNDLRTMPHFRPTTTSNPVESNVIVETVVNKSVESNAVANVTEIFYAAEDAENQTLPESTTESVSTTDSDTTTSDSMSTTDERTQESPSTENSQKVPIVGGMLFQDMEQPEKVQINYKLRGVNACPVKEEVVAPFWANNTRGEVLALLNLYPFEQYVHWEKCTFEHRQMYCRDGCRCEQQYRLHRLLAYDPNNECRGIFSDWFRFPSCCVCKCYNMPMEFRVTSRSPRSKEQNVPNWFKKKNGGSYED